MKLCLFFIFLSFAVSLGAQTEGVITYQEKIDMHRRLPEDRQQFKDMIPQYRTSSFELLYTEGPSLYRLKKVPEDEEMTGSQNGGHFRMRMARPERTVYKHVGENKLVDSREFMTKKFLIKGQLDQQTWKISDGQKQIQNYMCLKAVYQDTSDTYTVWFTPQIPVSNGPAEYNGLPGMILVVDMNEGERVLTATEIQVGEVDKDLLEEPKKGKEVTSEEFRQIVREKMQEMHEQGGGGPRMHIIRQ